MNYKANVNGADFEPAVKSAWRQAATLHTGTILKLLLHIVYFTSVTLVKTFMVTVAASKFFERPPVGYLLAKALTAVQQSVNLSTFLIAVH